jgi:hypothetical protein
VFHPSMDVDGASIWVCVFLICWIASTIDCFNCFSFSQWTTLFAFFHYMSLNTCFSIILFLVVALTSTTFISTMIVCALQQKVSMYAKWFHWILNEFIGYNEWGLVMK